MSEELGIDAGVEDLDDDQFESIYLKYCFDGAVSLLELTVALRAVADDIDNRAAEGWRLIEPVDGGWAHLEHP